MLPKLVVLWSDVVVIATLSLLLAYGWRKMKDFALVDAGEAMKSGLLTMTEARWDATVDFLKAVGLARTGVDYSRAWTLEFVRDVRVLP